MKKKVLNNRFYLLSFVLIVLLGVFFNKQSILSWYYENKADYFFKNNDMINTQLYLKKAFDLGVTNPIQREVYVNSIINSPLTTSAQEKLVEFLEYPIQDKARENAENFLKELKFEINKKYVNNYISTTTYNNKVLRWNKFPITYGFENIDVAPKYFTEEIENAFLEWEIQTDHKILFERNDYQPNIKIKYIDNFTKHSIDKKYVVAYTVPETTADDLLKMNINFYLKDGLNELYTNNQVYNTALHEIAHAIGFIGHSNDRNNIMYLSKDSAVVSKDLREKLNEADVNTITLLYDIKPDITNCRKNDSKYIPYLILGDDITIVKNKMEEAFSYIKKVPELPAGYIDLAEGYVANKDYFKAIKFLEKALRVSDSKEIDEIVYYNLSVCYFNIEHYELALKYLEKSIKIKDEIEKHRLLAQIYTQNGEIEKAKYEYQQLILQDEKNIEHVIALTNIYINEKKYLKARKILKRFIEKNPKEKYNSRLKPYGILIKFL